MSIIVVVGSGMMGSALAVPLCENGHLVRLVGSPLDADIISSVACVRHMKQKNRPIASTYLTPGSILSYLYTPAYKE